MYSRPKFTITQSDLACMENDLRKRVSSGILYPDIYNKKMRMFPHIKNGDAYKYIKYFLGYWSEDA